MAKGDLVEIGGGLVEIEDENAVLRDIGATDGDIEFGRTTETKVLEDNDSTGGPLQIIKQVILREKFTVKIPAVDIDARLVSMGALNIPYETVSGSTITVAMGQAKTFAVNPQYSTVLESIILDGPGVASLVVKNSAENTTYATPAAYFLDADLGVVFRNPSGTITSGQIVHLGYTWDEPDYDKIKLGVNSPIVNRGIKITHVSGTTGRTFEIRLWKTQGNGNLSLNLKKTDFWKLDMEFTANPDSANHSTEPVGYIKVFPAP